MPSLDTVARLPAWVWLGGLFGAAFVLVATLAIPRIGALLIIGGVLLILQPWKAR